MERGYAKMALDTCLVDQVARNFDARIGEVQLYMYIKMALVVERPKACVFAPMYYTHTCCVYYYNSESLLLVCIDSFLVSDVVE